MMLKHLLPILILSLSFSTQAQSTEEEKLPIKSLEKRVEAYGCEPMYRFKFPTKKECNDDLGKYAKKHWMAMHKKYYEDLEELYRDNKLPYDKVVDEFYKLDKKHSSGPNPVPISRVDQFGYCLDFVCQAFDHCAGAGLFENKRQDDFLAFDVDSCYDKTAKLKRFTNLKTQLILEEHIHRRQKLATVEEGLHRSVQLFFGVLEKTFKVLREAIELERKLDIYVRDPIQKL